MAHRVIIGGAVEPVTEDERTHEPGRVQVWHVFAAACLLSFLFGLAVGV